MGENRCLAGAEPQNGAACAAGSSWGGAGGGLLEVRCSALSGLTLLYRAGPKFFKLRRDGRWGRASHAFPNAGVYPFSGGGLWSGRKRHGGGPAADGHVSGNRLHDLFHCGEHIRQGGAGTFGSAALGAPFGELRLYPEHSDRASLCVLLCAVAFFLQQILAQEAVS